MRKKSLIGFLFNHSSTAIVMSENEKKSLPLGLQYLHERNPITIIEPESTKKQGKKPKNEYESHFSILNRFVDQTLKSNLTATELKIWLFLLRHSKKGIASVGYSKMMKDLDRSKTSISDTINSLIEKGIIERIIQGKPERNGQGIVLSKYRLL